MHRCARLISDQGNREQCDQATDTDINHDSQATAEARKERGRRRYESQYREWFYPGAQPWVFLDDLPPAGDLAFAALVNEWQPMYEALKRLDLVDEVDVGPAQ